MRREDTLAAPSLAAPSLARFPSLAVRIAELGIVGPATLPTSVRLVPVPIAAGTVLEIGGWRLRICYWSSDVWKALPEESRPAAACPADSGSGVFGIVQLDPA